MTRVFIAGSRQITRIPPDFRSRIDTIVEKGFQVLIGDANGADKAVQRYLADLSYKNVLVFCMRAHCRYNLGRWPTREIVAPPAARGFDYYATKDRAMAEASEYGLMLWDGKSRGTLNNVLNLCRASKVVVVYVAPKVAFQTIRNEEDLRALVAMGDPTSVKRLALQLQLADEAHRPAV